MKHYIVFFFVLFVLFPCSSCGKDISNKDKAKALNRQIDVLIDKMKASTDSSDYYATMSDIVKFSVLCDHYDCMPNKKGRVKPKYREANIARIVPIRNEIVAGCSYYYNHRLNDKALDVLELYLETANKQMFINSNKDINLLTYYASLLSYGMKKYKKAEYYADLSLKDGNYAKDAAEIKINCMKHLMVSKSDSDKFVVALSELHDMDVNKKSYTSMLLDYYTFPGRTKELKAFVCKELEKDSLNTQLWAIKGEIEMKYCQWNSAIKSFGNVVKRDSLFVHGLYNIGICYSSKAVEMQDSLKKNKGRALRILKEEIVSLLNSSKYYLEKVRFLDPKMKLVKWAIPLYQVYFVLRKKKEANELKQFVNN